MNLPRVLGNRYTLFLADTPESRRMDNLGLKNGTGLKKPNLFKKCWQFLLVKSVNMNYNERAMVSYNKPK